MFEVKNVSKQYHGDFALREVSLTLGKGLNFIIGASGSGKTTLLKMMSGMEQNFEGEIFYNGKSLKTLANNEKSYIYGNVFGFVWQDFNLLEDATVIENVMLPQYLKDKQNRKKAENLLREIKMLDLANQKVKLLSGGQKQRVAIARELMKEPEVIFADEPTSALDAESASDIIAMLRNIAKNRTVIIVTHDTSLIMSKDHVYELDKGELISGCNAEPVKNKTFTRQAVNKFSLKNAFALAKLNCKSRVGRFAVSALSLMIASVLLLTTVSGMLSTSGQKEFDQLFDTYGRGILDINMAGKFIGASGENEDAPAVDVSQDISGLYDRYVNDERVEYAVMITAFKDISVKFDGQEYTVEFTGQYPYINEIVAGRMPNGSENEVIIPQNFVKTLGLSNEDALGKEIEFRTSIYNWDSGEPVPMPAATTATIVGIIDPTITNNVAGDIISFAVDDTFVFSKSALEDLRSQAGLEIRNTNFTIRAKSPEDMISLKDEFNQQGIVPTGRFELVEDLVRLNAQTTEQSGSASIVIAVLSLVMVTAIFLITGFIRKREYAIYKVTGFNNTHLNLVSIAEMVLIDIAAIVLLLITAPLINFGTQALFRVDILSTKMLLTGSVLTVSMAILGYLTTIVAFMSTNIVTALKTGER